MNGEGAKVYLSSKEIDLLADVDQVAGRLAWDFELSKPVVRGIILRMLQRYLTGVIREDFESYMERTLKELRWGP